MLQIKVGTNTSRQTLIVPESDTPKDVLEKADVDYSIATIHLDGSVLSASEMNTSLSDLGITESAQLIAVVKQENA